MANYKGFLQNFNGEKMLPITRAELVLDSNGNVALTSALFESGQYGNQFGLINADDLALLRTITGGTSGEQNLGDIYDKLSAINTSLKVGNTYLPFYSVSENTVTTNNIQFVGQNGIKLYTNDSNIYVELDKLNPAPSSVTNQIVTNITVDEYGRVTAVSGTNKIDNNALPDSISGKDLTGCTVTTSGSDSNSLVNKQYVDNAVGGATAVASGALVFSGTLNDAPNAANVLNFDTNNQKYYKVLSEFELDNKYIHDPVSGGETKLYPGDTLIAYKKTDATSLKFIYIPSGNDITAIYARDSHDGTPQPIQNGSVGFEFDGTFFDVTKRSNVFDITMNAASESQPGYLSAEGFNKLKNASSVSYEAEDLGERGILLGTITINNKPYEIHGINNITKLSLIDGADEASPTFNPRLKFEESGNEASYITFQGGPGIIVKKRNENKIEFGSALAVDSASSNYLHLSYANNTIGIKLGNVGDDWLDSEDGLVNVNLLQRTIANYTLNFAIWNFNDAGYDYGSDKLVEAITI